VPAYVGNGGSHEGPAERKLTGVAASTDADAGAEGAPTRHRGTFGSLRVPNYRRYAGGQVVALVGTWMQRVAQDWLVLELSGGSPIALGIAAALQFGPILLFSLWAGVLADRMDKRLLLVVSQSGLAACALLLGALDVTGLVALWHVYVLCLLVGCATALDQPVRQSFVIEMVGRDQVANAVAMNAMTFNTARIIGPAIAGVLIAVVGTGWLFLINAASFIGTLGALLSMDRSRLYRPKRLPRERGQLAEGLRYVRAHPELALVLVLVFCIGTFGLTFYATLAVVVRNVFHQGPQAYGLLSTMFAIGTLAGATMAARRAGFGRRPRLSLVVGAAMAFGALEIAVGLMPTYLAFGLMLIPTGAAALTFTTAANASVQLSVAPTVRGRVMALYMLLFVGGTPIGGPLVGWLAASFGGRAPIVLGGAVSLLAAAVCGILLARTTGHWGGSRDHGSVDNVP
jgi:MFS family permease